MVLTGNQIASFLEYTNHMGIEKRTGIFLQEEGINTVGYLVDFTEYEIWRQFTKNCKSPLYITSVGGGSHIPQGKFFIASKSLITSVEIPYY